MAFIKKGFNIPEVSKVFTPTVEQVFNKELIAQGKNVKIVAGAGSGKSSSLRYTASSIPEKNFLVLCFNKANAKESNEHADRPDNIFYSTIHSLAYKQIVDYDMKKKLKYLSWNDLDTQAIEEIVSYYPLDVKDSKKVVSLLTKECLNSVNLFCRSAGYNLLDFVSNYFHYTFTTTDKHDAEFVLTDDDKIELSILVYNYWLYIINPKSTGTISHDVYLKLYDLGEFLIEQVWDDRAKSYIAIDIVALDECLTAKQTVKTDKGLFRIERLYKLWANKESLPLILSFNRVTETYEYKPMLSALQSHDRDTLLIKTEGLNRIECTPNHKLLTQRGYVEADSLVIGQDYVLIDNPDNQKAKLLLNDDQYQIVLGSFLGDGSLEKRSKFNTYRLKFTQGIAQLEYLTTKAECFQIYELGNIVSGYTGLKDIYTAQSKTFILDYDIWVCLQDLDVRGLAIWYMDDGSFSKANNITISSNSFTLEEHEVLVKLLQHKFDLTATIGKTRTYYELKFNVSESKKLLELVKDYMHENLDYKNPYSTDCAYNWDDTFKSYGGNFVSSIEYIGKHTVYDIEVADNHNFITTRTIDNYSKGSGIIVHNCQDTNPVSESIFARQEMQKVLVGDPMQQLYAWRGAGDCMNKFKEFDLGYLTESFRFNSSIADKANKVLELSCSGMRLKGSSTKTEITSYVHLCRTNSSVLEAIFGYLDSGKKVYTSIDLGDVFSKLYHIQACFFNQVPKYPNKELSAIVDRVSLEKALEFSDDLARLTNISKKLTAGGETLFNIKKRLDTVVVKVPSDADISITTIHASKGMEYGHVVIDDDILPIGKEESVQEALDRLFDTESLRCLLYVAITRAEVEVVLPWYFKTIFKPFNINTFATTKDAKNDYCDYIGADTW